VRWVTRPFGRRLIGTLHSSEAAYVPGPRSGLIKSHDGARGRKMKLEDKLLIQKSEGLQDTPHRRKKTWGRRRLVRPPGCTARERGKGRKRKRGALGGGRIQGRLEKSTSFDSCAMGSCLRQIRDRRRKKRIRGKEFWEWNGACFCRGLVLAMACVCGDAAKDGGGFS